MYKKLYCIVTVQYDYVIKENTAKMGIKNYTVMMEVVDTIIDIAKIVKYHGKTVFY